MTTSLVAAALLMHRRGIAKDELLERVITLYHEVAARKGHIQINLIPTDKYLDNALQYLGDFVETRNGHIVHPRGGADLPRSIMMLSYYRNAIVHFFMNESEIMTAVVALQATTGQAEKSEVF